MSNTSSAVVSASAAIAGFSPPAAGRAALSLCALLAALYYAAVLVLLCVAALEKVFAEELEGDAPPARGPVGVAVSAERVIALELRVAALEGVAGGTAEEFVARKEGARAERRLQAERAEMERKLREECVEMARKIEAELAEMTHKMEADRAKIAARAERKMETECADMARKMEAERAEMAAAQAVADAFDAAEAAAERAWAAREDAPMADGLAAALAEVEADIAASAARAERFRLDMKAYVAAEEAAMDAALCRLFDEYRESFWHGPFGEQNSTFSDDLKYGSTELTRNTFPEQREYAYMVYNAPPGNTDDITLPKDKIQISKGLLSMLCRIKYYEYTSYGRSTDHLSTELDSITPEYTDSQRIRYDAGYLISYPPGCFYNTGNSYKYGHVLDATPILHGDRIYIKVVFGYAGTKYIDPSVCRQYLNSKNTYSKSVQHTQAGTLPDAFVELPAL